MSMLGEVFGSLGSMSELQLLMAFVACAAYAFAQGSLLPPRGRRFAWGVTSVAAIGFIIESPVWTLGIMLVGFAVAGLGTFVALVWVTSRLIGFGRQAAEPVVDLPLDSSFPMVAEPRGRGASGAQATGPAHFV